MARTLVIGDIHGNFLGLEDVLRKCKFKKSDTLISLGDFCDGGNRTKDVIDRLLKIPNFVNVLGNHDCLTPDAEALTQRGWLKYTDLSKDDLVYSFDTEYESGKWMPITEIIVKHYNGNTIITNSNRCRMQVTPTHRVLCKTRSTKNGVKVWSNYKYIHANDKADRIKIISTADSGHSYYNISDDKIKLTAWILTDGYIDKNGYVTLYQSKKDTVIEISDILDRLNYKYTKTLRERNILNICGKRLKNPITQHYEFHINSESSRQIREYIKEKIVIPPWVYELSHRQFEIFLYTLIRANGTFYNRGNEVTSILYGQKESLDNIQAVCATRGYTATMVYDNRGDPRLNICDCKTIEFDRYKSVSEKYYNGDVWCITTPLTNFMVRQNGTHFFTGNCWAVKWMQTGDELPVWWHQGGMRTAESYGFDSDNVPHTHIKFIEEALPYYIDDQNRAFVHGGFDPLKPLAGQATDFLIWDRDLLCGYAPKYIIEEFKHVFVGHTTTQHFGNIVSIKNCLEPLTFNNLTAMDTGGGWNGRLSVMDVNTFEFWQSEISANKQNEMAMYQKVMKMF